MQRASEPRSSLSLSLVLFRVCCCMRLCLSCARWAAITASTCLLAVPAAAATWPLLYAFLSLSRSLVPESLPASSPSLLLARGLSLSSLRPLHGTVVSSSHSIFFCALLIALASPCFLPFFLSFFLSRSPALPFFYGCNGPCASVFRYNETLLMRCGSFFGFFFFYPELL